MSVNVVPVDAKGAMLAYLQSRPGITAICPATHILGKLNPNTGLPDPKYAVAGEDYAIAVVKSGGPGPDLYAPIMYKRLDFHLWAKYGYEAERLWRTVRAELEPTSRVVGFTSGGCRIMDVHVEAESTEQVDVVNGVAWPKVWSAVMLTVFEVPV